MAAAITAFGRYRDQGIFRRGWERARGYTGEFGGRVIHFNRARVIGGCSSHNAGAVVFGSRFDYDGWAAEGNAGWSARELLPLFAAAWKHLPERRL